MGFLIYFLWRYCKTCNIMVYFMKKTIVRVKNETSSTLNLMVHPPFENSSSAAVGAFGKGTIGMHGSLYVTILWDFYIAALSNNPDGSSCISNKLSLENKTEYEIIQDEENESVCMQVTGHINSNNFTIKNTASRSLNPLIYSDNKVLYKLQLKPSISCSIKTSSIINGLLAVSIYNTSDFPTFFKSSDVNNLCKTTEDLINAQYVTWELTENVATGEIHISKPDYTPFPPYGKK